VISITDVSFMLLAEFVQHVAKCLLFIAIG
jgi:hypothetical protein